MCVQAGGADCTCGRTHGQERCGILTRCTRCDCVHVLNRWVKAPRCAVCEVGTAQGYVPGTCGLGAMVVFIGAIAVTLGIAVASTYILVRRYIQRCRGFRNARSYSLFQEGSEGTLDDL